jgi:hypothetical protein
MNKEGLPRILSKKENLEILKRVNFYVFSRDSQESQYKNEMDRPPSNFFSQLSVKTKLNWLIYELSKLSFLSKNGKSDWTKVERVFSSEIVKIVFTDDLKDDVLMSDFKNLSKDSLRNKANQWKSYCKDHNLNKDFYSHSKIELKKNVIKATFNIKK